MKLFKAAVIFTALTAAGVANAYTMPDNIWVSGDATPNGFTNWINDWGVTGRQMMTNEGEGTFVWMGKLTTNNAASVRLFPTSNEWGIAFAPEVDGTEITTEEAEYPVKYFETDNNFKILTAGYYKFTLTLTPDGEKDGSLKVEYLGENAFKYDLPTNIWMTGSSTPNGWTQGPTFSGGRMLMEKKGYNVYEYSGTLKAAETDGFKFVCEPWAWYPAFGPVTNGEKITTEDGSYDIVNLVEPADAKFAVEKEGPYVLTLTLDPMNSDGGKLDVVYKGVPSAVSELEAEDTGAVEELYNLNGVSVSRENAVPGIYVIRKGCKAKKVVIK